MLNFVQVTAACRYAQKRVHTEIVRSLSSAVVRIHVPNHCWSNMFINVIETYKTVGSHSPNPKHLDHWFIVHEFTIVINSVETPLPILLIHSVCPLECPWMIWCKQFRPITYNISWQKTLYSSLNHLIYMHVYGEISLLHKTRIFGCIKVNVYPVCLNLHVFFKEINPWPKRICNIYEKWIW